jgi:hypothetical protein
MLTLLRHDPGSVAPRPPEYFPPLSRAARTCIVKAKPAYFAPSTWPAYYLAVAPNPRTTAVFISPLVHHTKTPRPDLHGTGRQLPQGFCAETFGQVDALDIGAQDQGRRATTDLFAFLPRLSSGRRHFRLLVQTNTNIRAQLRLGHVGLIEWAILTRRPCIPSNLRYPPRCEPCPCC